MSTLITLPTTNTPPLATSVAVALRCRVPAAVNEAVLTNVADVLTNLVIVTAIVTAIEYTAVLVLVLLMLVFNTAKLLTMRSMSLVLVPITNITVTADKLA